MAMCMSGVRIGQEVTRRIRQLIRRDLTRALNVFSGAVPGPSLLGTADRHLAAGTWRTSRAAPTLDFVLSARIFSPAIRHMKTWSRALTIRHSGEF